VPFFFLRAQPSTLFRAASDICIQTYDHRNFERHRRDALVMERLSSSHHLVSIYGYCANTVLTEAISHTLDDVIYARENEEVAKWSPRSGYVTRPPLESWMAKDEDGEPLATRETELGRIRLALGVFRGLKDLHDGDGAGNMEWLPVVHADLQAKQYLVDSLTGKIYLNDFNRCRFLTRKDSNKSDNGTGIPKSRTLESCPLYIPTAPGSARAPEEYDMAPLSEKLDIFSAGNILYGIITGNRPWSDERGKHIRAAIQKGDRPPVNDTIRNAAGTVDAELTRLLDRVYEHDPTERASAREVVLELESLLERELRRKSSMRKTEDHADLGVQQDRREEEI
jgi:serine/threonine protein kinase